MAIVMTMVGLGFKVAAVPFHFWAPDVYQGAPAPSAALIASASKVASFFILYQVMVIGLAGAEGSGVWHGYVSGWVPVVAIVASVSMVLGNLVAILQTSVRRLLAYSAVAHAGYMLLGILSHTDQSLGALLYYCHYLCADRARSIWGGSPCRGGDGRRQVSPTLRDSAGERPVRLFAC